MIPGIMDFKLIREAVRTSKPQTPSAYRFGRLSHHSFFSRHHPQPQHVTHIQDLTGKPVCVVRDELSLATSPQATLLSRYLIRMPTISVPVGDPQSNRDPRLYSEAWKKELKDLASRVAIFTKESELKSKEQKEEPQREQGAKYSAETGRLIPASTRGMIRRHSHQGRNQPASRDGGDQTFVLQDQELLILELLSQILQTDSLNAIQFWLLYAPTKATAHPPSTLTGSLKPHSRNNPGTNAMPRRPLIHHLLHFLVTLFSQGEKCHSPKLERQEGK
ncbi:hypothetical protein MG293_020593 [Ovis ammon polii]|uniref:Protein TBATA n=1 Tax=Ovis ammon polii TaxID=230172 RepID=A0AAD4XX74_OVIAM|nr:hypothetical protein MG293_020593 [Ovis ammon polii]KAI4550215.1 hypothetical protein MJT46_018941 [Ovis ammon polii x Ovis aries]